MAVIDPIKKTLFEAGTDVEAEFDGIPLLLYCDSGNVNITVDDTFYHFDNWEQMLKEPIFHGSTYEQISKDITLYW